MAAAPRQCWPAAWRRPWVIGRTPPRSRRMAYHTSCASSITILPTMLAHRVRSPRCAPWRPPITSCSGLIIPSPQPPLASRNYLRRRCPPPNARPSTAAMPWRCCRGSERRNGCFQPAPLAAARCRVFLDRVDPRRRGKSHPRRLDQPLHRAAALRGREKFWPGHRRGRYFAPLPAHRLGVPGRGPVADRVRRRHRRAAASNAAVPPRLRDLGRGHGLGAAGAGLSAVPGAVRPQRADHHHARLHRRVGAGHPQDHRGPIDDAARADQRGQEFQAHPGAAVLEDLLPLGAADDLRWHPAWIDLCPHQRGRRRVFDQFRRARPSHQRARRALRPRRHLCGDLLRHPGQRGVLHGNRKGRAMADIGRLTGAKATTPWLTPVTLLRLVIVLSVLVVWQLLAVSGWFYGDVVPSLRIVTVALVKLLSRGDFYWNLWATIEEIAIGLAIGGILGIVAGLVVGANAFLAKAFEPYLYYLGPTPKIIFFPVMIMWFGTGYGSKIAMGAVSCFFPIALNVAAGMRQIDRVLIRVGKSFRANPWQMALKIYLPAMRHPIINGLRLGLGVALIGTLLAETKMSNRGIGFMVIDAYTKFDMPRMYAILIVLFVLAIAANALVARLGGLDDIKQK